MSAEIIIVVAGALAAGFTTGLAGFGTGLTALGFWLHVIDPVVAAPLVAGCSVVGQVQSLIALRPRITLARALPFIVPGLIGVPLGALLLLAVDPAPIKIGIGILLITICSTLLFLVGRITVTIGGRAADGGVGFLGGILGGLAGLSGILPTLWCTLRGWPKDDQRAIYQPYNLAILAFAMIAMGVAGLLDRAFWILFATAAPATVVGVWLGVRAYRRVDERAFRYIVLSLLLVSGAVLIATNI